MDQELFEQLRTRYQSVITSYDPSKEILQKHQHSLQVAEISKQISEFVLPSKSLQLIAEIAGLFHDIGRFEQFKRYQTFVDAQSENHALLGIQIIKDKGLFSGVAENETEILFAIIENHNKRTVSDNADPNTLEICNIVRDADKIDILKLLSTHYLSGATDATLTLGLPESPTFNPKIVQSILNAEIANYGDLHSLNDFKLLKLSWAFDLNFAISHVIVHQAKYMKKIHETLTVKTAETDMAYSLIDGISEAYLH